MEPQIDIFWIQAFVCQDKKNATKENKIPVKWIVALHDWRK